MIQYTDEEKLLLNMIGQICDDMISDRAATIDEDDEFPVDIYNLLAQQYLLGLSMPEEYGGLTVSTNCWAQCVSRFAEESSAVALMFFVLAVGCDPLVRYGSEEQKAAFLPQILSGEKKISFALTEPNAGSDIWSMRTTARATENGYRINGNKLFISNAEVADYFALFAMVDEDGEKKPTCFIVDATNPGLSVSAHEKKLGLRGSPTCPVFFENMDVSTDAVIGEVGQGAEIAFHALNRARLSIAACALGIAKASLKASATYATGRRQFNTVITDFQNVGFALADMEIGIQAAELMLAQACKAYEEDALDVKTKVAAAKAFCSDLAQEASMQAVQIHGGYGFCKEYPVERYYRDAKALTIIAGTNQIQRSIIAQEVCKRYKL